MCINDAVIQVGVDDLPFGGIGQSGMGHYHGHEGFLTLSKAKSVMRKGKLNSTKFVYPPYGRRIQKWLMKWLTR
jgi:coniferyl-aldehyde dehydrogenase